MRSRVLDLCGIIRVQTWDPQAVDPSQVEEALGIAWPKEVGTIASGQSDVLCVGPTDWLVISVDPDAAALLQLLEEACEGSSFRATNMSSGLARIEIESTQVRALLAKGCSLDLDASRFPPGRSARTRFAGMPVIVRCKQQSIFECIVTLSFRDYLLSWLNDAAMEF